MQEWANEKPKLDDARRLGGMCLINLENGDHKETIKTRQGKSWEVPVEAAIPCKKGTKKHLGLQETVERSDDSNKIQKTKHACTVEAHESTEVLGTFSTKRS